MTSAQPSRKMSAGREFRVSVFVMQKSYSLMIFFNFTQGEDIVNIETYLLGRRIRKCVITVKNMK